MRAILLLALVSPPALAAPTFADHRGTFVGDAILWTTWLRTNQPEDRVVLAVPLPAEVEILDGPTALPVRDDAGRVIAFETRGLEHAIRLRQPVKEDDLGLSPPIPKTDVVQRVALVGARVEPIESLGFERHIRYFAQPPVEHADLRRFDRHPLPDTELYLVADDRLVAEGLRVRRVEPRRLPAQITLGAVLGAVLLSMIALFRTLAGAARAERNRAYIEREFGRGEP